MATAYWTGSANNNLDDSSNEYGGLTNWQDESGNNYVPQNGDDLIFSQSTANWLMPATHYAGAFDGMTFGTVTASDGSNCLDGTMACGAVYLTNGSTTGLANDGGTCDSVNAGADGSACTFQSICTGDAVFGGGSTNFGSVSGTGTFNDSSNSANSGSMSTGNFYDNSNWGGGFIGSVSWYSGGSISDTGGSLNVASDGVDLFANPNFSLSDPASTFLLETVNLCADISLTDPKSNVSYSVNAGSGFAAGNIKSGATILDLTGTAAVGGYLNGASAAF